MRKIEDILNDMHKIGMTPETINDDMLKIVQSVKSHIVSIDEGLNEEQVSNAFEFMYECHKRNPISTPVSISLNESGGIILNRGTFAGKDSTEIADSFQEKLKNGEPKAVRLNQKLLIGYHQGGVTA